MSLVLNGGVAGSGSTQAAYVNAAIVDTLPISMSVWFKTSAAVGSGTSRSMLMAVDKDATVGQYMMGCYARRGSGPILATQGLINSTTISVTSAVETETVAIDAVTVGSSTVLETAGHDVSVGMWVRVTGATGLTPDLDDKDYEVTGVSGGNITINVATTGTYAGSCTVSRSQIQPALWCLAVMSFNSGTGTKKLVWSGIEGGSLHAFNDSTAPSTAGVVDAVFATLDRVCLGASQQATNSNWFNGELAHAAIWNNTELTAVQAAELLSTTPDNVTFGTPAAYWPLTSDENDTIGTNHLTLVGSPTVSADGPGIVASGATGYFPSFTPNRGLIFGAG